MPTLTPILWMLLGVPLVVDLGATVVCGLKRKRGCLLFGVLLVAFAAWINLGALRGWDWIVDESFPELYVGIIFVIVLLPTTVALLVDAILVGKPGSWWVENISSDSGKARALARFGP